MLWISQTMENVDTHCVRLPSVHFEASFVIDIGGQFYHWLPLVQSYIYVCLFVCHCEVCVFVVCLHVFAVCVCVCAIDISFPCICVTHTDVSVMQ